MSLPDGGKPQGGQRDQKCDAPQDEGAREVPPPGGIDGLDVCLQLGKLSDELWIVSLWKSERFGIIRSREEIAPAAFPSISTTGGAIAPRLPLLPSAESVFARHVA